jgi:hypothetical protein
LVVIVVIVIRKLAKKLLFEIFVGLITFDETIKTKNNHNAGFSQHYLSKDLCPLLNYYLFYARMVLKPLLEEGWQL